MTPISFTPPPSFTAIKSGFQGAATAIDAAASASTSALSGVTWPTVTQSSAASAAQNAHSATEWADGFSNTTEQLIFHPWLEGVAINGTIRGFVSPQMCALAAANNLLNKKQLLPQTVDAIFLYFSAFDYLALSNVINSFCAVMPVPKLLDLAIKSELVAKHEASKLQEAYLQDLPWLSARKINQLGLLSTNQSLASGLALCNAQAMQTAQTPRAELAALIAKKQALVANLQGAANAGESAFSGGAGDGVFYQSLTVDGLVQQLRDQAETLPVQPLAVAVLWVAPVGALDFVCGALGL